ncbi:MAG: DUF1289 domain-containing protein [Alphaproteobacteria bacterium]|nr:DUF1289 domain-containing protein [Alphaproteobacteria bacterium]
MTVPEAALPTIAARTIASPCVGVCQIDRDTGFCLGCWRTLKEIAHWARYDDPERLTVLEALRQRQTEAGVNRRRVTRRRRASGSKEETS